MEKVEQWDDIAQAKNPKEAFSRHFSFLVSGKRDEEDLRAISYMVEQIDVRPDDRGRPVLTVAFQPTPGRWFRLDAETPSTAPTPTPARKGGDLAAHYSEIKRHHYDIILRSSTASQCLDPRIDTEILVSLSFPSWCDPDDWINNLVVYDLKLEDDTDEICSILCTFNGCYYSKGDDDLAVFVDRDDVKIGLGKLLGKKLHPGYRFSEVSELQNFEETRLGSLLLRVIRFYLENEHFGDA